MKRESKAESRWSWMNAIAGFLAAGMLSLGICNVVSGRFPHDIDLVPLLPVIVLGMLAGAIIGGAAQMHLPARLHALSTWSTPLRWLAVTLFVALSIALAASAIEYESSHPVPSGWDFPDW